MNTAAATPRYSINTNGIYNTATGGGTLYGTLSGSYNSGIAG